jgi:hypothetical protein
MNSSSEDPERTSIPQAWLDRYGINREEYLPTKPGGKTAKDVNVIKEEAGRMWDELKDNCEQMNKRELFTVGFFWGRILTNDEPIPRKKKS